jgi:phosphatidate cytidylyltransferase
MNASRNGSGGSSQRPSRSRGDFQEHVKVTRAEIRAHMNATRAQLDQTNKKIRARTGRNLVLATLIGLALGGLMLVSLIFVKELFMVLGGVLLVFTAFELASSLRQAGRNIPRVASVIAAIVVIPASYYFGSVGQWVALFAGIVLLVVWRVIEQACSRLRTSAWEVYGDIRASIFVQVYVVFLGSFAVLLTAEDGGQWWTLAFLILVIATDTGAYVTGLMFGKHPLAPTISPKKTWEGFAGSAVIGIAAAILLSIFMLHEPWWFGIIFGFILVVTATFGDLTESFIKRDLGIKDMSTWLPGHGGFLDRFDSILPSAAVAYALFLVFG